MVENSNENKADKLTKKVSLYNRGPGRHFPRCHVVFEDRLRTMTWARMPTGLFSSNVYGYTKFRKLCTTPNKIRRDHKHKYVCTLDPIPGTPAFRSRGHRPPPRLRRRGRPCLRVQSLLVQVCVPRPRYHRRGPRQPHPLHHLAAKGLQHPCRVFLPRCLNLPPNLRLRRKPGSHHRTAPAGLQHSRRCPSLAVPRRHDRATRKRLYPNSRGLPVGSYCPPGDAAQASLNGDGRLSRSANCRSGEVDAAARLQGDDRPLPKSQLLGLRSGTIGGRAGDVEL